MNKLYNRSDIVNFMKIGSETTYTRMTGFTDGGKSLNAETYERRYIDEKTKRKDVTGYATEIKYGFDRMIDNLLHDNIAKIHDDELVGETREIVTVNFNEVGTTANTYRAKKRIYTVIPDGDGDGTDAYQYTGTFAAQGDIVEGIASTADNWQTVIFTADVATNTLLVTFNISDTDGQVQNAKIIVNNINTIYTDVNGIATVELAAGTYSNIVISKTGYTTQSDISINVTNAPVYKEITLVKTT